MDHVCGRNDGDLQRMFALYDNGHVTEALDMLHKLLRRSPQLRKNGDFCILQAELEMLVHGDTCKALDLIDKANEFTCTQMAYYYKVRGDIMAGASKLREAAENYQQSIALEPDIDILTALAQVLSMLEDTHVTGVCQQILNNDPDNPYGHIYLGWQAARAGEVSKAFVMGKRAEKRINSAHAHFELARLYQELGEYQDALNEYLEASRTGYRHKGLLYACIAASYLSLGLLDEAHNYCLWAIRCEPDNEYAKEVWDKIGTS